MNKRLFFICPTDFLETAINDAFKGENYFVTSLGNSMVFDANKIGEICALIEAKDIQEIVFILSDDNRFFLDAFGKQEFSKIPGLSDFYTKITHQDLVSLWRWQTDNLSNAILLNYLNDRILELQCKLDSRIVDGLTLDTKIYYRQRGVFDEVHSGLLNIEMGLN